LSNLSDRVHGFGEGAAPSLRDVGYAQENGWVGIHGPMQY
jgi:hypothetical protein